MLLVAVVLMMAGTIVPHHHHSDHELGCIISDMDEDHDCEGGQEDSFCISQARYVASHISFDFLPALSLISLLHNELQETESVQVFFEGPDLALPDPPFLCIRALRAPPANIS